MKVHGMYIQISCMSNLIDCPSDGITMNRRKRGVLFFNSGMQDVPSDTPLALAEKRSNLQNLNDKY